MAYHGTGNIFTRKGYRGTRAHECRGRTVTRSILPKRHRPIGAFIASIITIVLGCVALYLLVTMSAPTPIEAPSDPNAWNLTLVNADHALPEGFSIQTATLRNGEAVDERIYEPLCALLEAAEQVGFHPYIRSGFRTRAQQEQIMADRIAGYEADGMSEAEAQQAASQEVAQPGTSEHELGLAVDINDEYGDDAFYSWIAEHAHEYGFILRYPADKIAITGIEYEPWHFRYVGADAAKTIYQHNLTLEEYLGERAIRMPISSGFMLRPNTLTRR